MAAATLFGLRDAYLILAVAAILLVAWLAVLAFEYDFIPVRRYLSVLRRPICEIAVLAVIVFGFVRAGATKNTNGLDRTGVQIGVGQWEAGSGSRSVAEALHPHLRSSPVLQPDVCDVGDGEGFGGMPIATNLMVAAILRGSNATHSVVAWPPSVRPASDLVDLYAGTNLLELSKLFTLDVSQCVSNAFVSIADESVSGTNGNAQAFFSVGDATDSDGDGLSDSDERFVYGTNPADFDTDWDGIDDGEEITQGTSPLSSDTDGDALCDGDEVGWIRRTDGFEWYDSTGWTTEYGVDPYAWLGGNGIGSPMYPSIYRSLSPTVSFYDTSLTWLFAYHCGYASFFSAGSFAYNFDPLDPSPLSGWASNCGTFLVVPYWMTSELEIGNTNSFMRVGYVATNGVHVVEYRNLKKYGTDLGVTMQIIVPTDSNRTVRISYLCSDFWLDGDGAVVGVQNKDIVTTNGYYNLTFDFAKFGPILPQTTWEYRLGYATNPALSDTDGDGLSDNFEIGVSHSDPLSSDGDGDGLADVQEYSLGTNPKLVDSDGDLLPDGWEILYALNPLSAEGDNGRLGDIDNDGMANWQEYRNGTNPRLADTDGDGLSDSEELSLGTNPCLADTDDDGVEDEDEIVSGTDPCNSDSDYDGISDGEENVIHTNQLQPDTDMDGMNDGWEYRHFPAGFNPLVDNATDANADNDINADPDGDGLTNGQECDWNTNPSGQDGDNDGIADGYDTDGDDVSDGAEVTQNSDPNDAEDGGLPNSRIPVPFTFGDPSGSVSEKYQLEIRPVNGVGGASRTFSWVNERYGECETKTGMLKPGWKYEVRLRHAGTSPNYDDTPRPDYDYELAIAAPMPDNVILDDPSSLFGTHTESTYFAGAGKVADLYVLGDPVLVFDYDRDGSITDAEADIARDGTKTFRFWVNDDNDSGDRNDSANDIPGSGPNYADDHVNGHGDFIDFTPVWIDTRAVFPPGTPQNVRDKIGWKVRSGCAKVVWSRISRVYAGAFHREDMGNGFGMGPYQQLLSATVASVANGAQMPDAMHDAMQLSQDCGVFLIEGSANGADLVVEGWIGEDDDAQKAVDSAANIRISSVEDMYRHLNTRGLSDETVTWSPSVGDPVNRPDAETSSTNLVFLHGANVSQANSRAWASEVFKRMWQSGMTAQFTAVSWRSDIGTPLNYQEDASNAFFTASVLAPQLAQLPGTKVLMAHSLGNMVCSSMIQDYGLVPSSYLMCNSAVPSEAFETTRSQACPQLIHPQWSAYHPRTWASNWHALFAAFPNDDRRKLGWPGRFSNVAQYAVNFYSTGDEALMLVQNNNVWLGSGVWDGDVVNHCWHKQEMFKGRGGLAGTDWAGWELQKNYHVVPGVWTLVPEIKYNASAANGLTEAQLRADPVFNPSPTSMMNSVIPRLVIDANLAQGIPALMPAAGAGELTSLEDGLQFDVNLESGVLKPDGWPDHPDYSGRWCHSDMKDVAYFYNFKFYDKAVEKGNLK